MMAGIHLLPLLGATAFGSALGGVCSSRRNYTFWTLLVATSFQLLGTGLLSTSPDSLKIPVKQYGFQVILGIGMGMSFSTITIMTSVEADIEDMGKRSQICFQLVLLLESADN
jgi:hypothetical protein